MNIGFYGHSNIAYTGEHSYLNIVAEHFNANIACKGVKQGSEERILFDLKKTKRLNFAIVVHSHPSCIFLPGCDRDISLTRVNHERIDYLSARDKGFMEAFETTERFREVMEMYKQYFYHPDLFVNRYLGAAQQIVHYLESQSIPSIHIIKSEQFPSWFSFGPGIVNANDIANDFDTYEQKQPFFYNCISAVGNQVVADKLIDIMRYVVR